MTPGNTAILIGLGLFWAIVFALRSAYLAGVRDTRSIWQDHLGPPAADRPAHRAAGHHRPGAA